MYLYIDIEGKVGKSATSPTDTDNAAITDGQLTVIEISIDSYGNIFPESIDPEVGYYDLPCAEVIPDPAGNHYHDIP